MKTSPWLVMICAAAVCSACIDEPHRRLTVWPPAVFGISANRPILRPMFRPCSRVWLTQPQMMSSTSRGSKSLRSTKARTNSAEMLSARTWRNIPFLDLPIAERTPSTMTTSFGLKVVILSSFSIFIVSGSTTMLVIFYVKDYSS